MSIQKKSNASRLFILSLVLIVAASLLNWGVISSWGQVSIRRVYLTGDNGMQYSAVLYVPNTATNKTPAPAAIFLHGGSGNARNHESQAMEFARRGFVCLCVDNQGSGESEYSKAISTTDVPETFLQYMLSMDIIDKDNIAAIGHSAGGGPIYYMGAKYGLKVLVASDCSAGQASLSTNTASSEITKSDDYHGNLIYINGAEDFLNPRDKHLATALGVWKRDGVDMGDDETVVIDKLYGSFEEGNAHMFVEIPGQIHEICFLSAKHNEVAIDFVLKCMGLEGKVLAGSNQIWQWAQVTGALGMLAFAFFLCQLVNLLLNSVPYFSALKQPMPRNVGLRGPGLAISIIAAVGFPILCLYTGSLGIVNLIPQGGNSLFRVSYTTLALDFVIGLNIFGLVMIGVFMATDGRKHKAGIRELGLVREGEKHFNLCMFGRSLLLAVLVLLIAFEYLDLQQKILGTEFYCLFFGVRPIALYKFKYFIPYILVWVLCFCIAAVSINVERRLPSTGNETADLWIAIVFNCACATAAIVFMIFLQYYLQVNVVHSTARALNWKGAINRLWGVPAGMIIGISGNTYCYRKTGNIWLGALLFGAIAAICGCTYGTITLP